MTTNTPTTNATSTHWKNRPLPQITAIVSQNPTLSALDTEPSMECPECHYKSTITVLNLNQYVCPNCDAHLPLTARNRIYGLLDEVSGWLGESYTSGDPLHFVDSKAYPSRLQTAQDNTNETDALLVAHGYINDLPVVVTAFEFAFLGGSMGSVVGDRFVAACHYALEHHIPLVCCAASGGARMQEGVLSLVQMARTAAAIGKLHQQGVPYIVVHTNPCYGGVSASLAMLGDIHLAEPKAMIGFAGKRVIQDTVRETLAEDFQTAEFLLKHGAIDQIVHRHDSKKTLYRLLSKLLKR